ncbi:MAG: hypothetical protein AB4058_07155 [Microcystaceae cyanobacterium]
MANPELKNLDKNIERLKAQLANKRNTLVTIAPEEQMRIEQQIEDLREQIQKFEQEKYELIASLAQEVEITEAEAEPLIVEIITDVEGNCGNYHRCRRGHTKTK